MYKFLTKNGQLIAFGVGAFLILIFIVVAFSGLDEFHSLEAQDLGHTSDAFNAGINAAIALIILCTVAMLFFGLYQVLSNLKNSLKGLIGFGAIILVYIVAANMAPMETTGIVAATIKEFNVSPAANSWISGGIITTLVLLGGAALAFIVSEVLNFLK